MLYEVGTDAEAVFREAIAALAQERPRPSHMARCTCAGVRNNEVASPPRSACE